jgi:hypothetical protein
VIMGLKNNKRKRKRSLGVGANARYSLRMATGKREKWSGWTMDSMRWSNGDRLSTPMGAERLSKEGRVPGREGDWLGDGMTLEDDVWADEFDRLSERERTEDDLGEIGRGAEVRQGDDPEEGESGNREEETGGDDARPRERTPEDDPEAEVDSRPRGE